MVVHEYNNNGFVLSMVRFCHHSLLTTGKGWALKGEVGSKVKVTMGAPATPHSDSKPPIALVKGARVSYPHHADVMRV